MEAAVIALAARVDDLEKRIGAIEDHERAARIAREDAEGQAAAAAAAKGKGKDKSSE